MYGRHCLEEAGRDLAAWLSKYQARYSKLCDWVEEHIEETLTYYRPPLQHDKEMRLTNTLERINGTSCVMLATIMVAIILSSSGAIDEP